MPVPIRAIIGRFSFDFSQNAMEDVMRKRPFEFAAIISHGNEPQYFTALPREQQRWFVSSDIRGCRYDGVDWNAVAPLDQGLLEHMHGAESVFMEMVSRLEWKRRIAYATRKEWYEKHVRFWNDFLNRHRINLYLSAWIPHEIPDIVIYHLCKAKGIPVLYSYTSTLKDVSFFEHDITKPAPRLKRRYAELLAELPADATPESVRLSPHFEESYRALTLPEGQRPPLEGIVPPQHWDRVRRELFHRPWRLCVSAVRYLTPAGMRRALGAYERWNVIRRRNAFYNAHLTTPDFTKPFVYLALHFQPEASTVPMAGVFANQLLIAEMLDATLPDNVLLYVKEHPRESAWLERSVSYYENLLALPKVRLIGRHVDTFLLRERCVAVATATGSVGFEALYRGKPVFMFGHRFYEHCTGVHVIETLDDLQRAVHEVFAENKRPSRTECRLFLQAIDESCVHGTLNPWDHTVTRISDEEHVRRNSEAMLRELSELEGAISRVA